MRLSLFEVVRWICVQERILCAMLLGGHQQEHRA